MNRTFVFYHYDNVICIQIVIDKEERVALTQMANKVKDVENAANLVNNARKSYCT